MRARMRTLTIPAAAVPSFAALLRKWEAFRGPLPADASYWKLPSERASGAFVSTVIDKWLRCILLHLGIDPPPGELWTGHSLRKGAATGSHSIDVFLTKICHMGGWSITSTSVHDYIDPTALPSPAAYYFFGWLKA